jgi:hypothetical protein
MIKEGVPDGYPLFFLLVVIMAGQADNQNILILVDLAVNNALFPELFVFLQTILLMHL